MTLRIPNPVTHLEYGDFCIDAATLALAPPPALSSPGVVVDMAYSPTMRREAIKGLETRGDRPTGIGRIEPDSMGGDNRRNLANCGHRFEGGSVQGLA
jgi:hypothetical protein